MPLIGYSAAQHRGSGRRPLRRSRLERSLSSANTINHKQPQAIRSNHRQPQANASNVRPRLYGPVLASTSSLTRRVLFFSSRQSEHSNPSCSFSHLSAAGYRMPSSVPELPIHFVVIFLPPALSTGITEPQPMTPPCSANFSSQSSLFSVKKTRNLSQKYTKWQTKRQHDGNYESH